jgi:pyridoxal phosphate enzyme (YggS family)
VAADIGRNLPAVLDEVKAACARAGRSASEVKVVAVSKNFPPECIMEAYHCGHRVFGENRVQELLEKMDVLPKDIEWHFIGGLQRNKVKSLLGRAALIHSLDSAPLAEEISRQAVLKNLEVSVLIQVNVAKEVSKRGFAPEELGGALRRVRDLPGLRVCGLMTVGPWNEDPEEARPVFRKLRLLSAELRKDVFPDRPANILSMGMSGDFAVAVEEGASLVRIGTGIFGSRYA